MAGFDLVHPFSTTRCELDPGLRLPNFSSEGSLAVLVGNSRALWPALIAAIRARPSRLDRADVVDTWAEETIAAAASASQTAHEIRWAHRTGATTVPIQRIAHAAGLAWLSPANLSIHPHFGPWIGLRAVVVFDLPGPHAAVAALDDPCGHCDRACLPAFEAARHDADLKQTWRDWLAIRDACPLGRAHRYGEDQIAYHYTKDLDILRHAVGLSAER